MIIKKLLLLGIVVGIVGLLLPASTVRAVENGLLYAGTSNPGVVYAYDGTTWTAISGSLGYAVLDLIEFDGYLYAATMSTSSPLSGIGKVWRYEGGTSWTLMGDNLDDQVCDLEEWNGDLYAGTAWNGGKLYRYDAASAPHNTFVWVGNVGGWSGIRSLYPSSYGYLQLGDIGYDKFGRFDGTSFFYDAHLGGSCIYDFAEFNNGLYGAAYIGRLHRSTNGVSWYNVLGYYDGNMWELEPFQGYLYLSYDNGVLARLDTSHNWSHVWTGPDGIISMLADGDSVLYLGIGGEAGAYYGSSTPGTGYVYAYTGSGAPTLLSGPMGTGVQCLHSALVEPELELIGMEINQCIQNWENSVSLVEGKTTYVRAHIQTKGQEPLEVSVRLRGYRGGVELPRSPLTALNLGGVISAGPDVDGRRGNWDDSVNFRLPQSWLQGTVELRVEAVDCGLEYKEPAEPGGSPYDGTVEVTFTPVDEPKVMFVGVPWIDGQLTTHAPTTEQLSESAQRLRAIYPIDNLDWTVGSFLLPNPGEPDLSWTNLRLELGRLLNCALYGDCDRIYYGVIVDAPHLGGLAKGIPGTVASGDMGAERNVHAHEIGHCLGRHHAANEAHFGTVTIRGETFKRGPCGSIASMSAPEFPYIHQIHGFDRATIGPMDEGQERLIWGLDTHTVQVVDPCENFELMSYCQPLWISDFTYDGLRIAINNRWSEETTRQSALESYEAQNYLLVRGKVDFQHDTVEFLPFTVVFAPTFLPTMPLGDYVLELSDSGGNIVTTVSFRPNEYVASSWLEDPAVGSFIIPVLADPTITQATVYHNGVLLSSQPASSNPPTVQVLYPNGGENLGGEKVTLEWTGSDPDGDDLTFIVLYSSDAGNSWQTLTVDWPSTDYQVDRGLLEGTDNGLIRIVASDAFNTAADESDGVFSVADNVPDVTIIKPEENALFTGGQLVFFEADARDREDGRLLAENLLWTSNVDGTLGSGRILDLATGELTEGHHTVTVIATDSEGQTDSASVGIWVFRELPANMPPVADAGPDQSFMCAYNSTQRTKVTLDGTNSSDPDGDPLIYTWTGPFDESPANGPTPTVTLSDGCPGDYVITLVVNDGELDSNPDEVVITVQDPVAAVTYDGDTLLSTAGNPMITANLIATLRDTGGNVLDIDNARLTFMLTAEGVGTIVPDTNSQDGLAQVVLDLEPAIYKIDMTLDCSEVIASAILVVYNPEGGFATGGGWIVPEYDGLNTHPNVRANFGFNAKYKQDNPTGHLEFRYSDGYIDLKSYSIEQLVITGRKIVQFKGWALVNHEPGYWFFVKGIDEGEPGINDTFNIKIWAPGVSEEGDPTDRAGGVLQGGNIVVHTKDK